MACAFARVHVQLSAVQCATYIHYTLAYRTVRASGSRVASAVAVGVIDHIDL